MTLANKLRRETTNAATYNTQTFNTPGNYSRPYGRTNFTVTALAASGGAGSYTQANPTPANNPIPTGSNFVPGNPFFNPYYPAQPYFNPYYPGGYVPGTYEPGSSNPGSYTPGNTNPCYAGPAYCQGYGCCASAPFSIGTSCESSGGWSAPDSRCAVCWIGCTGNGRPGNENPGQYTPGSSNPGYSNPGYYEPPSGGTYAGQNPASGGNYGGQNPAQPGNPNYSPGNPNPPNPAFFTPGSPSGAYSVNLGGYVLSVPGTSGSNNNGPAPGAYYTTNLTDYQVAYAAEGIAIPVPSNASVTIQNKPI